MHFFETSAKTNTNVAEAFEEIATVIKHKMDEDGKSGFSNFVGQGGFSGQNKLTLSVHGKDQMTPVHACYSPSMIQRGGRTKDEQKAEKNKNKKKCC